MEDELEPMTGPYDWEEAFRQNPGDIDDTFCQDPDCEHPGCNGQPDDEMVKIVAAALTVQTEPFLGIAHLDPDA